MCSPSIPAPPDPRVTAGAQTAQNIGTSIANSELQNVNQVTPWGNLNYDRNIDQSYIKSGTAHGLDPNRFYLGNDPQGKGFSSREAAEKFIRNNDVTDAYDTYTYVDPNTGDTHEIPKYTATTTLPRSQQKALDAQFDTGRILSNTAKDQSKFLRGYLNDGMDVGSLPDMAQAPNAPNDFRTTNMQRVGKVQTSGADAGKIDRTGAREGGLDYSRGNESGMTMQGGNTGGIDMRLGNAGKIDRTGAREFNVNTAGGNTGGIALGEVGQGQIKRGQLFDGNVRNDFDAAGQIVDRDAQGGDLQSRVDGSGSIVRRGADGGDLTRTYGNDFSEDRYRVEDALMQRMDRQISKDREALQSRLANQGIAPGSEAYKNAMDDLERQISDSRLGTILSAGEEQSRLAGLERDRAQFQNTAQGQAFSQDMANINARNAAQGQQFGQNLSAMQARNSAQAQSYQQDAANIDRRNAAQGQRFGQLYDQANFHNQAQAQSFDQRLADRQQQNAAQAQDFSQDVTNRQLSNQAQQQRFDQTMANAGFGNDARQQKFDNQFNNAQFANQAQAQQHGQNLDRFSAQNQAQQQRYTQEIGNSQFQNQAQQQRFNQDLANADQRNEVQAQRFQQQMSNAQFANQAQQQQYNQMMGNRGFENQAQQQQFDQQRALASDFNANQNQLFNQQLASAQQKNASRGQSLQEMFALRNQPINEISALLSGSQVSNPGFSVNTPGAIPTTDYAGIVGQNYGQQLQRAQMDSSMFGDIFGGLAGLGSAAIKASDTRTKRDIEKVGEAEGLGVYEYRYAWETTRRRGFMAQEVARTRPDAVKHFGGTMILDYSRLPEVA